MAIPPSSSQTGEPKSTPSGFARNLRIMKAILPKLPLAMRVALTHVLGLSESSKYLGLQNDIIVAVLRSFVNTDSPLAVASMQKLHFRDIPLKGKKWIAKYTSPPPPETDSRDVLMQVIERLMPNKNDASLTRAPELVAVEAEWTGYRYHVTENDAIPNIPEQERYNRMMQECTSSATVLFLHGGGYYFLDPSTHRPTTTRLAKISGGRCYSVRYRLSPQHAFPSALLDAFVSYLTLLYPPPEALHKPVRPEHIVLSGDSAGGNLSLALLRLLLELHRMKAKVKWYGESRDIPLPAGAAVNSPWLDITQCLVKLGDSYKTNFDYLPKPNADGNWMGDIKEEKGIWPPNPPRVNIFADDHLMSHPLVSLTVDQDWTGCPPIYLCTGWEVLATEDKYFAKKLAKAGVPIVFEEYEGMPHCFAMVLPKLAGGHRCFNVWGGFIKDAVERPSSITSSATSIKAKSLEEVSLDFDDISHITEAEVASHVQLYLDHTAATASKL